MYALQTEVMASRLPQMKNVMTGIHIVVMDVLTTVL